MLTLSKSDKKCLRARRYKFEQWSENLLFGSTVCYTATGLCKQFDFKTDFHLQMGSTIAEKWKSLLNLQKTVAVYYKYNHLGVSEGCDNNISNHWIRPTICKNVEKFKTILASHKKCVWRLTATTHFWLEVNNSSKIRKKWNFGSTKSKKKLYSYIIKNLIFSLQNHSDSLL